MMVEKACPIVLRSANGGHDVLAFEHPCAGNQFVKGSIEAGEPPLAAAIRELREESGLVVTTDGRCLGDVRLSDGLVWHFYLWEAEGLADRWRHQTEDDFGHEFSFFWRPLMAPLNETWAPIFHDAHAYVISQMSR